MSSTQKKGFRLPWGAERPEEGTNLLDPAVLEARTSVVRKEPGEGPFGSAGAARSKSTEAAPAADDVPENTPEAAMIDADEPMTESAAAPPEETAAAPEETAAPPEETAALPEETAALPEETAVLPEATEEESEESSAWPTVDRRSTDRRAADRRGADRPFMNPQVAAEQRMPRRDNPLVAGLVKAMREAALASRGETSARLEAEATARVEAIRARATTEVADLRKRSEEDMSAIREWSKAELARVRQETDERMEARKAELGIETTRHAASVDQLVEEVQSTVAAFEADMDRFFERLMAENDPATLASLAEQAPDPPDLRGDGPSATDLLASDDAAEAEAEATEGIDPHDVEAWPTAMLAAARRDDVPTTAEPNGADSTRLLVSGLTSVAGISAFKGALAHLPGVHSVSVSSGEPGVFVFAVNHDPGVDLDSGVSSLPSFGAHITDATDDGFVVVASEPAAA